MTGTMPDASFWQDLADRMNAEQARLKARYDRAEARKRAILAAWLGEPEPASPRSSGRRGWFRRIPLFVPRRKCIH